MGQPDALEHSLAVLPELDLALPFQADFGEKLVGPSPEPRRGQSEEASHEKEEFGAREVVIKIGSLGKEPHAFLRGEVLGRLSENADFSAVRKEEARAAYDMTLRNELSGGTPTVRAFEKTWREWVGSRYAITWSSSGVSGYVNILLSRDGGATWSTIASRIRNSGSQNWTASLPATTQALIRVASNSNASVYGTSAAFSIV